MFWQLKFVLLLKTLYRMWPHANMPMVSSLRPYSIAKFDICESTYSTTMQTVPLGSVRSFLNIPAVPRIQRLRRSVSTPQLGRHTINIVNPNQSGIPADSKGVAYWYFNTNCPMPRLWYCKYRQKRQTLRARLRYLENSDQCIK